MHSSITSRHLNTLLVIVMMLGTATLAIIALGVVIFAAVLLHTALDAIIELVQTVTGLYTHGDALTRFVILVFILFLGWKAAPHVVRYVRREIAAAPSLFMREEAFRAGPRRAYSSDLDESEQAHTVDQDDTTGDHGSPTNRDHEAQARAQGPESSTTRKQETGTQAPAPNRAELHETSTSHATYQVRPDIKITTAPA